MSNNQLQETYLDTFLEQMDDVVKVREGLYKFKYKGVECAGFVHGIQSEKGIHSLSVNIRPMRATDNIGQGCGQSVLVTLI